MGIKSKLKAINDNRKEAKNTRATLEQFITDLKAYAQANQNDLTLADTDSINTCIDASQKYITCCNRYKKLSFWLNPLNNKKTIIDEFGQAATFSSLTKSEEPRAQSTGEENPTMETTTNQNQLMEKRIMNCTNFIYFNNKDFSTITRTDRRSTSIGVGSYNSENNIQHLNHTNHINPVSPANTFTDARIDNPYDSRRTLSVSSDQDDRISVIRSFTQGT